MVLMSGCLHVPTQIDLTSLQNIFHTDRERNRETQRDRERDRQRDRERDRGEKDSQRDSDREAPGSRLELNCGAGGWGV